MMPRGLITNANLYAAAKISVEFFDPNTSLKSNHGYGTCFIVGEIGTGYFVVTNRHVIDPSFWPNPDYVSRTGTVTLSGWHQSIKSPAEDVAAWSLRLSPPDFIYPHDDATDVAVARWGGQWLDSPSPLGQGQSNHYGLESLASQQELGRLCIGDVVYTAGYPAVGGVIGDRPILVSGTLASDPRYEAVFGTTKLSHSILCHSFSWAGMSGAPVLALSQGIGWARVVGVNAGHI
jgi:hypothetical protein